MLSHTVTNTFPQTHTHSNRWTGSKARTDSRCPWNSTDYLKGDELLGICSQTCAWFSKLLTLEQNLILSTSIWNQSRFINYNWFIVHKAINNVLFKTKWMRRGCISFLFYLEINKLGHLSDSMTLVMEINNYHNLTSFFIWTVKLPFWVTHQ